MRHALSHRPLRRLGTVTLAMAMLLPLGMGLAAHPVVADQIADKQAQADRLARQIDAQGERISVLDERLNEAILRVQKLNAQAATAQADLASIDATVRQARSALTEQAVASYVRGGHLPTVQAIATGQEADLSLRNAYVKTVTAREQSALDALHAAREQLDAKRAALTAAQKQAKDALAAADADRRAAAAAQAGQQRLLDQVKGDLADLVAAAAQRRAEEAAQRARAELASRISSPSAARSSSGRSLAPSGPEPPVSKDASGAVEEARRQLGKPYEYGGSGPDSFDCSGLTAWSWGHAGHPLPHSAAAQYNATTRVAISNLQPGDLVFFGSDIHHVGIYVGGGQMIEASHTGTPVRYASIYRSDLMGAGRVG